MAVHSRQEISVKKRTHTTTAKDSNAYGQRPPEAGEGRHGQGPRQVAGSVARASPVRGSAVWSRGDFRHLSGTATVAPSSACGLCVARPSQPLMPLRGTGLEARPMTRLQTAEPNHHRRTAMRDTTTPATNESLRGDPHQTAGVNSIQQRDEIRALLEKAGYDVRTPFRIDGPNAGVVIVKELISERYERHAVVAEYRDQVIRNTREAHQFINDRR